MLCSHYTRWLLRRLETLLARASVSHKNGDFGAISVTERSCAAPISKAGGASHIGRCASYFGAVITGTYSDPSGRE